MIRCSNGATVGLASEAASTCIPIQAAQEGFTTLAKQMGRWIEHVLGSEYQPFHGNGWRPAVNLYEDKAAYHLVADVAGIDPKAIDLRVEKRTLVLQGQRPSPKPPWNKANAGAEKAVPLHLHLMEINHGPFQRVLELPEEVDAAGIEACYRNGFLWVTMPKKV